MESCIRGISMLLIKLLIAASCISFCRSSGFFDSIAEDYFPYSIDLQQSPLLLYLTPPFSSDSDFSVVNNPKTFSIGFTYKTNTIHRSRLQYAAIKGKTPTLRAINSGRTGLLLFDSYHDYGLGLDIEHLSKHVQDYRVACVFFDPSSVKTVTNLSTKLAYVIRESTILDGDIPSIEQILQLEDNIQSVLQELIPASPRGYFALFDPPKRDPLRAGYDGPAMHQLLAENNVREPILPSIQEENESVIGGIRKQVIEDITRMEGFLNPIKPSVTSSPIIVKGAGAKPEKLPGVNYIAASANFKEELAVLEVLDSKDLRLRSLILFSDQVIIETGNPIAYHTSGRGQCLFFKSGAFLNGAFDYMHLLTPHNPCVFAVCWMQTSDLLIHQEMLSSLLGLESDSDTSDLVLALSSIVGYGVNDPIVVLKISI